MPDIRTVVGADQRTWGLVNSVEVATGLVAAVVMVGLISRLNTRRIVLLSTVVLLLDAPLMAASTTLAMLVAGAVVWSVACNLLETPKGALQLELQQTYGRPLIGSFTACWNLGSFAGGGMGIAAAALGLAPGIQLAGCSVVLGAVLLGMRRWLRLLAR